MPRPRVVVFDVNETLSDLSPLGSRFADVGAPQLAATVWFASLLRDGFALTAAGGTGRFSALAAGALRTVLSGAPLNRDVDDAIEHIMAGFRALAVHPDVPDGVRALTSRGFRLVTLSNGSAAVADTLLIAAGVRQEFERLLSVEQAGVWKPARAAYTYAAQSCDAGLSELLLVAVHPWDIDGAARAGMATAWLNRSSLPYPDYFTRPDVVVGSLRDLAGQLGG